MASGVTTLKPRADSPSHPADSAARPLRIGLMLRSIDEYDGAGVYIRKLCDALLAMDRTNQYVLFYASAAQAGRYAHLPNVREVVVRARGKLVWDQVAVPLAARREHLDVLFHHKFSIPVFAPCPTVVQQRGTEYWTFPEYYPGRALTRGTRREHLVRAALEAIGLSGARRRRRDEERPAVLRVDGGASANGFLVQFSPTCSRSRRGRSGT